MNIPSVSIGLPTFNRAQFLKVALESLRSQTFEDFELLISDNASSDPRVRDICDEAAAQDGRVRYIRQSQNRGALENFRFVYERARGSFFLWAADDDIWPRDFVARGVAALSQNPKISAWFCQMENVNSIGKSIRTYPSFTRFSSTGVKEYDLFNFLWEPEILGKANLIYSIFRRERLREIVSRCITSADTWGVDMALVYGFLCRNNILVEDDLVFSKRVHTEDQNSIVTDPRALIYPWTEARSYFAGYRAAAQGTRYSALTAVMLAARWTYDVYYHRHKLNRPAPWLPP